MVAKSRVNPGPRPWCAPADRGPTPRGRRPTITLCVLFAARTTQGCERQHLHVRLQGDGRHDERSEAARTEDARRSTGSSFWQPNQPVGLYLGNQAVVAFQPLDKSSARPHRTYRPTGCLRSSQTERRRGSSECGVGPRGPPQRWSGAELAPISPPSCRELPPDPRVLLLPRSARSRFTTRGSPFCGSATRSEGGLEMEIVLRHRALNAGGVA